MDSTIEEESDGGCEVVSNVTLDQQGFRNENLLSLRRSRSRRAITLGRKLPKSFCLCRNRFCGGTFIQGTGI